MPVFGEPRSDAADVFLHVNVRITDLMAGTAAETLLHPSCPPWVAHSDIRQARQLASIVCTSDAAIDAYLKFAIEEAKAIILQHRAAVLAIAKALMIERTLDSAQIDEIIAVTKRPVHAHGGDRDAGTSVAAQMDEVCDRLPMPVAAPVALRSGCFKGTPRP